VRRYYGLMAQRFCLLKREYQELFQDCFRKQVRSSAAWLFAVLSSGVVSSGLATGTACWCSALALTLLPAAGVCLNGGFITAGRPARLTAVLADPPAGDEQAAERGQILRAPAVE